MNDATAASQAAGRLGRLLAEFDERRALPLDRQSKSISFREIAFWGDVRTVLAARRDSAASLRIAEEECDRVAGELGEMRAGRDRLAVELERAAYALSACAKAALTVKPRLDEPYPDDPRWSPYTRWVERPARDAYNLALAIRWLLRESAHDQRSQDGTRSSADGPGGAS